MRVNPNNSPGLLASLQRSSPRKKIPFFSKWLVANEFNSRRTTLREWLR